MISKNKNHLVFNCFFFSAVYFEKVSRILWSWRLKRSWKSSKLLHHILLYYMIIFGEESSNLFLSGEKKAYIAELKSCQKLIQMYLPALRMPIWRHEVFLEGFLSNSYQRLKVDSYASLWLLNMVSGILFPSPTCGFIFFWNGCTPGSGFSQETKVGSSEALYTWIQIWFLGYTNRSMMFKLYSLIKTSVTCPFI